MRKTICAALGATALALAGCSEERYEIPEGPAAAASPDADASYLSNVRSVGITVPSDQTMTSTGRALCSSFDAGATIDKTAVEILSTLGDFMSKDQAYGMIAAAILAYCPEHEALAPK